MKNNIDYDDFYERVGRTNGWNFSSMNVVSEKIGWNFYEEVVRHTRSSDLLLDIGTGGGEAILSIAEEALLLVGIDLAQGMIETAQHNLLATDGHSNVRFLQWTQKNWIFLIISLMWYLPDTLGSLPQKYSEYLIRVEYF